MPERLHGNLDGAPGQRGRSVPDRQDITSQADPVGRRFALAWIPSGRPTSDRLRSICGSLSFMPATAFYSLVHPPWSPAWRSEDQAAAFPAIAMVRRHPAPQERIRPCECGRLSFLLRRRRPGPAAPSMDRPLPACQRAGSIRPGLRPRHGTGNAASGPCRPASPIPAWIPLDPPCQPEPSIPVLPAKTRAATAALYSPSLRRAKEWPCSAALRNSLSAVSSSRWTPSSSSYMTPRLNWASASP